MRQSPVHTHTGFTCHTPTIAFAMRMRSMTKGSTKAVIVPSPSSNHARVWWTEKPQRWVRAYTTLHLYAAWITDYMKEGKAKL